MIAGLKFHQFLQTVSHPVLPVRQGSQDSHPGFDSRGAGKHRESAPASGGGGSVRPTAKGAGETAG